MELNPYLVSIPAVLALLAKGAIYSYARFSPTHTHLTRIFLLALFALSLQNVAEISHYFVLHRGEVPGFELSVYYAASILALAFFFHLALALGLGDLSHTNWRYAAAAAYGVAGVLIALLVFSDLLISGYRRLDYSATRIPGPLYPMFELFAATTAVAVIALLAWGSRRLDAARDRARNAIVLLAITPLALLTVTVVVMRHLEIPWFNMAVTGPIAITVFLVVTAYAIHQHHIFDIRFFVPWSRVRRHKQALYGRIAALLDDSATLGSSQKVVNRLAEALACPVALVMPDRIVAAEVPNTAALRGFPRKALRFFDDFTLASDAAAQAPDSHRTMVRHGVGAVVPFFPDSRVASGWLLLGDQFDEEVYTPQDVRVARYLFDRLALVMLDGLLTVQTRLIRANRELSHLKTEVGQLVGERDELSTENQRLRSVNAKLIKERPFDSLGALAPASEPQCRQSITILGRDKAVIGAARKTFPAVQGFVGPGSASFRRKPLPDVLVCDLSGNIRDAVHKRLVNSLTQRGVRTAVLLFGPEAGEFAHVHAAALRGCLVQVLPASVTHEIVVREIRALSRLSSAVRAMPRGHEPLVGPSAALSRLLSDLESTAGAHDRFVLDYCDPGQARAAAAHFHALSGCTGAFEILGADDDWRPRFDRNGVLSSCEDGTLYIESFFDVPADVRKALLYTLDLYRAAGHRIGIILGRRRTAGTASAPASAGGELPVIGVPDLTARKNDLPFLIHCFTIEFNRFARTFLYLSHSDIESIAGANGPRTVAELHSAVFDALEAKNRSGRSDVPPPVAELLVEGASLRSLDDLVSEYEAALINQTLQRCNGNKSKAARMLGLRPNTLHYKLERYGLSVSARRPR
jgi:hypothetical protein